MPDPANPPSARNAAGSRRAQIRERIIHYGTARIEQLAHEFGVSIMTIHRDLDVLEREGWLRKVRGGATAVPSSQFHGDVRHRLRTMREAKEALAARAIELVEPGESVMLDESTTALPIARTLGSRGPVTAITHFLPAIKLLAGQPGVDLIALGGTYYPTYDAFFGMATIDAIRPLRADVLFMSTTAINRGACWHHSQETIQVKQALMAGATRRVLLVDHSKFSRQAVHHLAPLSEFDLVLVDADADAEQIAAARESGASIELVEAGTAERA